MRALAGAALALLLAGCASLKPPMQPPGDQAAGAAAQRDRAQALGLEAGDCAAPGWTMAGRVALSNGRQGGSGRIEWTQGAGSLRLVLSAPVTRQSWVLEVDAAGATLQGMAGGPRRDADAARLLRDATGWDIPVRALVDWVRGVPADASAFGDPRMAYGAGQLPASLEQAGWRIVASTLIDVAAMRRQVAAEVLQDEVRREQCVLEFRTALRAHVQAGMDALLALHAFRAGDAELADLPELAGRWKDDLFDPELLAQAGMRLGLGSVIGAGVGAIADMLLAGLSLGAATTLGATVGGALSGGWRPLWRKLENRLSGVQELTAEDALLWLLLQHLHALALALASRSHAVQDALRMPLAPAAAAEGPETTTALPRALLSSLLVARSHPDWERQGRGAGGGEERDRLELRLANQLASGPALA